MDKAVLLSLLVWLRSSAWKFYHTFIIQRWLKALKMGEDDPSIEPSSLEYIEDSYLPKLDLNTTPSLDETAEYDYLGIDEHELHDVYSAHIERNWSDEDDLYLRSLTLDQILTIPDDFIDDPLELQAVETEFSPTDDSQSANAMSRSNRIKQFLSPNKLRFLTRKKMRDVRVTFVDFSKPYLAKISSGDNYKTFLNMGSNSASEFHVCDESVQD